MTQTDVWQQRIMHYNRQGTCRKQRQMTHVSLWPVVVGVSLQLASFQVEVNLYFKWQNRKTIQLETRGKLKNVYYIIPVLNVLRPAIGVSNLVSGSKGVKCTKSKELWWWWQTDYFPTSHKAKDKGSNQLGHALELSSYLLLSHQPKVCPLLYF
jgi:hypothetical protein